MERGAMKPLQTGSNTQLSSGAAGAPPAPLRLLIVEDSPPDAELSVAALRRAGYALSVDVVDTPERFKAQLDQAEYDLILSDHNLVTWTGMDALEILHKSGKDIPLVVMTATLGDEAAVEYLRRGAADYILKHRLDRFPLVVDRVLLEQSHRREEARLKDQVFAGKRVWELTFDTVPDAVLVLDADRRVQRANRPASELLGSPIPQMLGKTCYELLHGGCEGPASCPHERLLLSGQCERGELDEPWLGKVFDMTSTPLHDPGGIMSGSVVVLRDITERKQAEARLGLQAAALKAAANAILITSCKGEIVWANPAFTELTGYTLPEVLGKNPRILKSDIHQPEFYQGMWNSILAGHVWRGEMRNRRKDGTLYSEEMTITPVRDAQGQTLNYIAIKQDITTRKQAEKALQASEVRYRRLFESAKDGILILDMDTGQIVDVNPFLVEMLGYPREEILLKKLWEIGAFKDILASREAFQELQSKGFVRYEDKPLQAKDGRRIDVEFVSNVYRVEDRKVIQCNVRDITERKQAQDEVRQLNASLEQRIQERTAELEQANQELATRGAELERASKFKDQFLSTMSHELRTPLNAVMGFSELLSDEKYGPLNERQQRYVHHIHSGGKHLLRLINDVLDLSKIEAGRMELAIESVSARMLCDDVVSSLRPLAEKKSQGLTVDCAPGVLVRADAIRLNQILTNLLGNAIKFTPEGGQISLHARRENHAVRVEVRDNGPGIPLDEQKRIFESFVHLQKAGKASEGTGLGLAITQRLVALHGGQLELESEPGKGSCFFFHFSSADELRGQPAEDSSEPQTQGKRVLVIEDDAVSARLLSVQLESEGFDVSVCEQPDRALAQAAEFQPAAITLDVLMNPTMGWEVLTELKNDPRTKSIPVIMVTVVDQPAVGATLGAEAYLIKPVEKGALLAAVHRCLRKRPTKDDTASILVVEDDAPTREMIAELLKAAQFSVKTAADGAEARAAVAAALPQLVILDLLLPKVNGFDLLAEWRAEQRTADLPVFVLTSKDLSDEEQEYLRASAKLLLRKQQPWKQALLDQIRQATGDQREKSAGVHAS
jgi:PAS domain S-box-containing protein